jgi:hypothetical protein
MSQEQAREAIRAFMKDRGLNTNSWSKTAKLPESVLRGFLAGRTKTMNASTMMRLAQAAGVSVAEMIGEAAPPSRERSSMIKYLGYHIEPDGRLVIDTESGGMPMAWRKSWVEQYLDGKSDNGRLIDVKGDTFTDELRDGDLICIHLDRTDPARDPGIYCVWDKTTIHIRRIQIVPGNTLRMLSDNNRYMPIDISLNDVQIVGRVVWRAGGI